MMRTLLEWYLIGNLAGLLAGGVAAAVDRYRRKAALRLALSFCRRADDGEMYIQDPQSGTIHKLSDLIARKQLGDKIERSPRQQRKVHRALRRVVRA